MDVPWGAGKKTFVRFVKFGNKFSGERDRIVNLKGAKKSDLNSSYPLAVINLL